VNYLAHLFLSPAEPQQQLGGLIADFTRGRLESLAEYYSSGVIQGIALHRQIDRFTDDHRWVIQSKARFPKEYRRYSGIILDILHDHFLSCNWKQYSEQDRSWFIQEFYRLLIQEQAGLPPRLKALIPRIVDEDWLGSYHDLDLLGLVYQRMSARLQRANPLGGAIVEVRRLYPQLSDDFKRFFPELVTFSQQQQKALNQT
jgi:acyl carrier protein phosphodiesterase